MKKSGIRAFILFLILLLAVFSAFYYIGALNISGISRKVSTDSDDVKTGSAKKIKKTASGKKIESVKKFNTKEDIRKEYGRLEVVYLYSGKIYEGAVTSIDDVYTMVTVNGTVRIPMVEVRARDIIR